MFRNIVKTARQQNNRQINNYFSTYTKQTTGLVGLPVQSEPREKLMAACENILTEVQGIPEDATYRQNVEAIYKYRLQICKDQTDIKQIEETVGLGHIEELLSMANDELSLIPKYVNGRMWEEP